MQNRFYKLGLLVLLGSSVLATDIAAQEIANAQSQANQSKSAKQRVAASIIRRLDNDADNIMQGYADFKDYLQKEYGLGFAVDVSFMPQYGAPNGKKTAFQGMIYPSITWQNFNNEYGTGTLTAAYNIVQYSGATGQDINNRIGIVTGINDYTTASNTFDELYYTYQLPGKWNWLSFSLGQYPIYNFDGTTYLSNQQQYFLNYAMSQNASSTYPTASLGGYVSITPNSKWNLSFGAQDATNITGESISTSHLDEKHYTTFASLSYTPNIRNLGAGQYSILFYNQPNVKKEPQTTNGWSINFSQDFGEKFSLFGRINGVSGSQAEIEQSWVLGMAINNPFNRNSLDQIGFAGAYNKINENAVGNALAHDAETVLETYWSWGISKWMTITPDIQFYFNPAQNPKSDHATVVSLRAALFF
ncbi:MAG: carbohydrate porin [Alphaproteobacteria bacterium]|nr:carbohydrate porin [Alphaproteobacteria bacterium]